MDIANIIITLVIGIIIGLIAGALYTLGKIFYSEYKAKKQWKTKKGVLEVKDDKRKD